MRASLQRIAGVDEAGRGPLAGPVVAAAVMFSDADIPVGLDDSKRLSARRRAELVDVIKKSALSWSLGRVAVADIDRLNILQATMLAMSRAVDGLQPAPDFVRVDGNRCPDWDWPCEAIVGGDAKVAAISAASILAKEARDSEMRELDLCYPGYGFAQHKGYPTRAHMDSLQRLGPCPEHRCSFGPVRALLSQPQLDLQAG